MKFNELLESIENSLDESIENSLDESTTEEDFYVYLTNLLDQSLKNWKKHFSKLEISQTFKNSPTIQINLHDKNPVLVVKMNVNAKDLSLDFDMESYPFDTIKQEEIDKMFLRYQNVHKVISSIFTVLDQVKKMKTTQSR